MNDFLSRLYGNIERGEDRVFCQLIGDSGEVTISWQDFGRSCHQFQSAYAGAGLAPGDLIFIFLRHGPELYGSFFGAMTGGYVPSFMPCTSPRQDPRIYWASHATLLARAQPSAIVATRQTFEEMTAAGLDLANHRLIPVEDVATIVDTGSAAVAVHVDAACVALLQHSSGTTGLKKGVALSYEAITRQLDSYGQVLGLTGRDSIVSWLPLYHDMGLIACCLLPAYYGLSIIHIDPFHWLARPGLLFDAAIEHKATLAWLPNFAFEHLALTCGRQAASFDLSGLRALINCSEPCKTETFDRFATVFAPSGIRAEQLQCCYAMAETVYAVSQTAIGALVHRLHVDPASLQRGGRPCLLSPGAEGAVVLMGCGAPIPGIQVDVYDENHAPLPEGFIGEIGLRGNFLFSGYNKAPELTAERLVDGTYFSRDLGFVADGNVFILGRIDDLIIINGRNLYAHEVDAAVGRIEGIKPGRCVAYPEFDPRVGSETLIIIAEQRRDTDRTPAEIKRDVILTVHSNFTVTPRKVHLVDEGWLVKTTSGKIGRKANQQKLALSEGKGAEHG